MKLERLKGSTAAKFVAWVVITLAGILCLGSAIGILVLGEAGVYENTEAQLWQEARDSVSQQYSVMALENYIEAQNNEEPVEEIESYYYQYGIIEADNLDAVNVEDLDSYAYSTFQGEISSQKLYKEKFKVSENPEFFVSDSIFGGASVREHVVQDWDIQELDGVVSDSETGAFYYSSGGKYYPVEENAVKTVEEGALQIDGYPFTSDEIEVLSTESTSVIQVENNECYLGGTPDREEIVLYVNPLTYTTYFVVSVLPEEVEMGWDTSDLYVRAKTLVHFGFSMQYAVFLLVFLSIAIGIACFVFLLQAAGHRKDTKEIVRTWIDQIPADLYVTGILLICFIICAIMNEQSYYLPRIDVIICICTLIICICWLLLLSFITLAVRVKTKTLWSSMLIYQMIVIFRNAIRWLVRNISILWKAAFILMAMFLFELILLVAMGSYGSALIVWAFEKVIITVCVFFAIVQMRKLKDGAKRLAEGDLNHKIDTQKMFWEFQDHGENLNQISEGMSRAVDARMKSERFKTELITNVSHDIKTPLTSIINYVDLLGKEELHNEHATEYLEVLERQSGRLKKLIEDLIEASKASSGSISVNLEKLEAGIFMVQTVGEFEEKTKEKGLVLQIQKPEEPAYIMADSRHFWRVIDNLMNNICKYAQPSTRVYIDMEIKDQKVVMTFRNTSKSPLNITSEELMERFVRGDSSRNTEGSGLGLSIARSLMERMGGSFTLYIDGDLFKVVLVFSQCL